MKIQIMDYQPYSGETEVLGEFTSHDLALKFLEENSLDYPTLMGVYVEDDNDDFTFTVHDYLITHHPQSAQYKVQVIYTLVETSDPTSVEAICQGLKSDPNLSVEVDFRGIKERFPGSAFINKD